MTKRRPFLSLHQSLKGNNRNVRQKNGRISRKTEDKVAQKHDILNYADGEVGIGWRDDGTAFVGV